MRFRRIAAAGLVLTVFTAAGFAANPAAAARSAGRKTPDKSRAQAGKVTPEDLFLAGYDLCEQGQYDLAVWPLTHAAALSKGDVGVQLWLAHALAQTGQRRESKNRLLAAERTLAGSRGARIANAPVYLACVRNYLGVLAALDRTNTEALVWFRRAAEPTRNTPSKRAPPRPDREPAGGAAGQADVAQAAERNKRLLDSHESFTWWVAPDEPLSKPVQAQDGPGLAREYAKAADARWRRAVARENEKRELPQPADAPDPAVGAIRAGPPPGGLSVPPVIVRLLDASGALMHAMALAQSGNLNEALRLADASRAMKPDAAEVHLLLADLFEARGWLLEAAESLEAAARTSDEKQQLARDRIAAISREHPGFQWEPRALLTSPHFRLRYEGPPEAAHATLALLERAREDSLRALGVELPVVYVRAFPSRAAFVAYTSIGRKTPPVTWATGYASFSPHSPGILISGTASQATLTHEYTHLVTNALARPGDLPHWVNEGISVVVADGRALVTNRVRAARLTGRLPRIDDLERFWSDPSARAEATSELARLHYETAQCAVSFFLNTYGGPALVEWLLLIRRGEPPQQSFEKLTGMTWDRFFQRWADVCLR